VRSGSISLKWSWSDTTRCYPEGEEVEIAADLVSRACLRYRISKDPRQPLILLPTTATPCGRPGSKAIWRSLGCLRSHFRSRERNDNYYAESLFQRVSYRLDALRRPFRSEEEACTSVVAFVDCSTTGTAKAASGSRRPPSDTEARSMRSVITGPGPKNRLAPSLDTLDPFLVSAGGGLDQSTAAGKRRCSSYVGHGRPNDGRGGIFPDSRRALQRYNCNESVDRIHIDVKFYARSRKVGYRITGDRQKGRLFGAGYDKVHFAVDDATRLACIVVIAGEQKPTTIGLLTRAISRFNGRGIECRRAMS
jgi:hypothetical protein